MVILYTYDHGNYINLKDITIAEMDKRNINRNIYVNLTNACPCACTFCLRHTKEMAESNNLWLKKEPTVEDVISEFEKLDLCFYNEIIFCGFGEPTERLNELIEISKYLKSKYENIKIRLNTIGLSDLRYNKKTAPLLEGLIDTVSISLNASTADEFYNITRNKFGIKSYEAMKDFAVACKSYVPNVVFTVVDCIGEDEIKACREISNTLGITLRVRPFE